MTGEAGDFLKPTEGKLSVKYFSATEASLAHPEENQDAIGFNQERGWAAVLDGVGGKKNGRLASQKGLKVIGEGLSKLRNFDTSKLQEIEDILATAHKKIQETEGEATMALVKMSDTVGEKKVILYQLGDSRVYFLHGGKISRLTFDSAVLPEEVAMLNKLDVVDNPDGMTEEERVMFRFRNVTVKTLGGTTKYSADYAMRKLSKGDKIILTTDGVHDNLTTTEIEEVVNGDGDSAKALVVRARERSQEDHFRKKPDDISAIVMEVE